MKILILNAVGCHLGYLGCYGNEWIATPNIDRLAADGIVFDQHFVTTPDFTPTDGARRGSPDPAVPADIIASLETSDLVAVPLLGLLPPWNLSDDLANVYSEDDEVEPWLDPPVGELTDDEAVLRVQDTYAAAVTWLDAQLGRLTADLSARPWWEELTIVFTASAGFALGEHGRFGCDRPWLHDEVAHVPLIIRFPGRASAGERVAALTQPDDLARAVAAWNAADSLDAPTDLMALVRGEVAQLRPRAVSTWTVNGRSEIALRTLDWSLILPGPGAPDDPPRLRQLFVRPDDRWEVNDVADHEVETAETLENEARGSADHSPIMSE